MTKKELIIEVSSQTGESRDSVKEILAISFEIIKSKNASGEEVVYRGFGRWYPRPSKAKVCRIISKNKQITIPACNRPVFKPAVEFVNMLK